MVQLEINLCCNFYYTSFEIQASYCIKRDNNGMSGGPGAHV